MPKPKQPKNPFRRVKPAAKLKDRDFKKLDRGTTAAGAVKAPRKLPQSVQAREKTIAAVEKPLHGTRPQRWVLARVARHASPRVIAKDLIDRLRRAPSEKNLRATRDGLHELGRRRGGGRFIRRLVTQELVDEFQAKED